MRRKNPKIDIDRLTGQKFKVLCVDDFSVERRLTKGKVYEVIECIIHSPGSIIEASYKIKADTNRTQWFSSGFFKKLVV